MHSSPAQTCVAIVLRQPMARLNLMQPLMPCLGNGTKQPMQLAIAIRCQWSPKTEGDHHVGGNRAGLCSTAAVHPSGTCPPSSTRSARDFEGIPSVSHSRLILIKIVSLLWKAPTATTGAGDAAAAVLR